MLVRFILPLVIIGVATAILYVLLQDIAVYPISDSLFVSSQFFFFYGLLRFTNATQIFDGFSYTWRRMFTRKMGEDLPPTFFEHQEALKELRKEKGTGNPGLMYLLISSGMFIVSLNLLT